MHEAFTRTRLTGYVDHIDQVASTGVAPTPTNDARFLFDPAMKELTLDVASTVFMGHEPGTDHDLVTKMNQAFTSTTRAGGAIVRTTSRRSNGGGVGEAGKAPRGLLGRAGQRTPQR